MRSPHLFAPDGSPLCPEMLLRDGMEDGDFWAHVFGLDRDDGPGFDDPELSLQFGPCPVCGETGACGLDDEGRPMVHVVPDEWHDDDVYAAICEREYQTWRPVETVTPHGGFL